MCCHCQRRARRRAGVQEVSLVCWIYESATNLCLYRTTLTDSEFNEILKNNDFLVWGGDVRDYEASQGMPLVQRSHHHLLTLHQSQPRRNSAQQPTPSSPSSASSPAAARVAQQAHPSSPSSRGTKAPRRPPRPTSPPPPSAPPRPVRSPCTSPTRSSRA